MLDSQYKTEINKISPSQDLIIRTKAAMLAEIDTQANSPKKINNKGKLDMKRKSLKRIITVAATFAAVLAMATTAFAAWHFLRPADVVEMTGNTALSAAFESDTAININQTVTSGGHTFTLLAVVSGEDITDHPIYNSTGEIIRDRTYAVLAIQNADGNDMPTPMDDDFQPFTVSPFVHGECIMTINAFTMYGGSISMVVDGIMYVLADFTSVTMYAGQGVYLGVNSGVMMGNMLDAFTFDQQTGAITASPYYEGSNVLFSLPLK